MEEDKSGNTPVHVAAKFGHWEVIEHIAKTPTSNLRQVGISI